MNIEDLTLKQIRDIAAVAASLTGGSCPKPKDGGSTFIGQYVIARCYGAGVHAGVLESCDSDIVVLKDSRRLWSWKASAGVALSGAATHGIVASSSKLDVTLAAVQLFDVCELIPCSAVARKSIEGAP